MKLPEKFVREGLELARGSTIFGVNFEDLSREELIACAAQGFHRERLARQENVNQIEMMRTFSRQRLF